MEEGGKKKLYSFYPISRINLYPSLMSFLKYFCDPQKHKLHLLFLIQQVFQATADFGCTFPQIDDNFFELNRTVYLVFQVQQQHPVSNNENDT